MCIRDRFLPAFWTIFSLWLLIQVTVIYILLFYFFCFSGFRMNYVLLVFCHIRWLRARNTKWTHKGTVPSLNQFLQTTSLTQVTHAQTSTKKFKQKTQRVKRLENTQFTYTQNILKLLCNWINTFKSRILFEHVTQKAFDKYLKQWRYFQHRSWQLINLARAKAG